MSCIRGHLPRSKAEIDAEIASLRNEAEEEMLARGIEPISYPLKPLH
ncbi:MAG: hypothetical protein WCJ35_25365 [Planctomycetota bacterium]